MNMKLITMAALAVLVGAAAVVSAAAPVPDRSASSGRLEREFASPPLRARPWAYWWWLNANVTKRSITRDLEAMKSVGLGGLLLFDVTEYGHDLVPPPPRKIPFMSPEWQQLVHHAMTEAARLGLQMSMNLSTSGGSLQAPWDMGEDAPKQLVWRELPVMGPGNVHCACQPSKDSGVHLVAVLAVRLRAVDGHQGANKRQRQPGAEGLAFTGDWTAVSTNVKNWTGSLTKLRQDAVADQVVDLTGRCDETGRLEWKAPEGRWLLLQFGWQLVPERGHDVDILNPKSVRAHWQRMGRVMVELAGPMAGRALTHFYNVSWEGTSPSWTPGFEAMFRKYRGYAVRSYLPVLAGIVVKNRDVAQRFQRDYCRTLSDCFLHNCYETFTQLCHQAGIKWHAESGGPWRKFPLFQYADQLEFWGRNDMPQGEFWVGREEMTNIPRTAMAGHIYGKQLVSVEAFTHMNRHWSSYPAILKPLANEALCDGANQFVWHTFSASPPSFGKPGIVYFAGTHLNPNVTWWEMARPFVDYLARCQYLLRQGRFVADFCCYTTTHNQQNWKRDQQRTPTLSMDVPKGYRYDLLSTETLLNRLKVEKGRLVLPGGMTYRLLVVDLQTESVPPAVLRRIAQLVEQGATVVLGARRPRRSLGLVGYPDADRQTRLLAGTLWGEETPVPRVRKVGKGRIMVRTKLADALQAEDVLPDCQTPWAFIHRRIGDADIYFLSGEGRADCTFRAEGKQPELWDPASGTIADAPVYRMTEDGRTVVPIQLPEDGSIFVVFRKPAATAHWTGVSGPRGGLEIALQQPTPGARYWKTGTYRWTGSNGATTTDRVKSLPEPVDVVGPWQVHFDPKWGGPESIVFQRLVPWNEHPTAGIKFYSGKATYDATVEITAAQAARPARLALGQVMCIARVKVNGHDKGIVWCAPWTVDVTRDLKAGNNRLEIQVINTWINRLIGDAALPPEQRRTRTIVRLEKGKRTLRVFQSFGSEDPLMPSGLVGPVRLEFGQVARVRRQ